MKIYIWILLVLCVISCKEESHKPSPTGDVPAVIKNYTVQNFHGASEIDFVFEDKVASYILAEYEPVKGIKKEVKASRFGKTLRLDGFEAEGEYTVKLYAVSESERKSAPVIIQVNPLTPPYELAVNSLEAGPAFGGFVVNYKNIEKADLILEVLTKDNFGRWKVVERSNNNIEDTRFVARGYPPHPQDFAFYIRDRWSNLSDTVFKEITPYEEKLIDMSKFYETNFPTDSYEGHLTGVSGGRKISFLFDGKFTQQGSWYTPPNSGIPMHFTIYLQGKYQLSRLKLWQRGGNDYYYQSANVKKFEVYGSNNPNSDGTWDSWTLLKVFENIKPSGKPLGDNTDQDNETAAAGEDFEFDLDIPSVSYLRIKVVDTWGNQSFMHIAEMEIYGAKAK
ncbi:DUF5000 domain-containing lipoprotein [Sphingobacterium faecale]|uniref:DUF5126 domain-containing protein n=1 Tax=Sphingobacterium faecale TaxID=2803775 RepID=A0ABS1R414_9SPHI|nr:DUF5000 domain-containing lipoprotein [Sphingobacterium faecale]MBL1409461.1 DUF5126 domain-containing protein [Sphingobacterium faecale]